MEDSDNSALARGIAVLRCVALARRPLTNREIVEATGIPKATASRIAAQLVAANLLRQQDGGEGFGLGPGVLDLSRAFLEPLDVRSALRTHLREFTETAGVSVHLGLRDGLDMVVIETVRPRSAAVVTRLDTGSRMPLATSAMGRAWLAGLDAAERQAILHALMQAPGNQFASANAGIERAQADIAGRGFCGAMGDWSPDVNAIGSWLRWPNGDLYAVSCGGPAYRLPEALLAGSIAERFGLALAAVCRETGAECPMAPASTARPPAAAPAPRRSTATRIRKTSA